MAVRSIAILLYVVLLVTLASVMEEASKCGNGWCPCMLAVAAPAMNPMRKLLHGEEEEGLKGFESLDSRHQNDLVGWDLRMAPSGPDPLHHNGGGSKKPRTP